MTDLVPHDNEKKDAYSRILKYHSKKDSGIVLNADEDEILKRWEAADDLMRTRKFRHAEIVEKLRDRFGISPSTAQNDIRQAQALFGAVRVLNKNYLLNLAIEDLTMDIERIKFDKTLVSALAKLHAERNKLILALGEEVAKEPEPTPIINISVVPGQESKVGAMTFEQAKELLQMKRKVQLNATSAEPIDYEDMK